MPRAAFQRVFLSAADVNALAGRILDARTKFLASGDSQRALRCAEIYSKLNTGLNELAVETAKEADKAILRRIDLTKSGRPPTGRQPGLADNIHSEAQVASVSIAYVGMGLIDELDKTVNPNSVAQRNDTYWKVQEFGHEFSHIPEGFFMGTGYSKPTSRPNAGEFRKHPLFVPSRKGGKFKQSPTVPERSFMRDGTAEAVAFWQKGVQRLQHDAAKAMGALAK